MAAYNLALRDAFTTLNDAEYKYDGTVFKQSQQATMAPAPAPPAVAPSPAPSPAPAVAAVTESAGTLYAQATPNGYQLIDTTPKKVLTLLKTSQQDYFYCGGWHIEWCCFKKNGEWYFECYKDEKLVSQKLQIKF